jgi:biotin carboxyl carrier protein
MATRESSANQIETATTAADHEAIGRLADELLPALIAKLTASGLGEIEVREAGWKARLRKPAGREESHRPAPRPTDAQPGHGRAAGVHDDHAAETAAVDDAPEYPSVVSPAVGVFQPRKDLAVGMNVRAGDKVGFVDVLGVHQDVVSPVAGTIGASLVEAGEAVEYGQELIQIEPPDQPSPAGVRAGRAPSANGKA